MNLENKMKIDSYNLANKATAILLEKKAANVKLYNVGEENPITDFYLNVTARSINHIASLADELAFKIRESGLGDAKIEGKRGNSWILLDFGDLIVNIFDREARDFYNLDRLMPENSIVDITDIINSVDDKMKIHNVEE